MGALPGHLGQPFQDRLGRVEVGEALGQVHRAVLQGDAGHPPDHGIGETGGAFRKRLGHGQNHSLIWNSWEKSPAKAQYFYQYSTSRDSCHLRNPQRGDT